jgi:hypothetical protein
MPEGANTYHSDWEEAIPASLYACHSTVHTATGYTPHHLLFGWQPHDLRVPLTLFPASEPPDVDAFELRFPRDEACPRSSVSAYPVDKYSVDWESGDELDLSLRGRLRERGRYEWS